MSVRFILGIAIVMVAILFQACGLEPAEYNSVDMVKYEEAIKIIADKLHYGDKGQVLDSYSHYRLSDRGYIHCKDFAFAFVSLYGRNEALVAYNSEHAFVLVGDTIIEPQGRRLNTSYEIVHTIKIEESDADLIKQRFGR